MHLSLQYHGLSLQNYLNQNICYLNSLTQCLFGLESFRELMPLFDMTCGTRFVPTYNGGESSLEWLRQQLFTRNNDFVIGRQCDSFEAMGTLFDYLEATSGEILDYVVQQHEVVACSNCDQVFTKQAGNDVEYGFFQISLAQYPTANDVQSLLQTYGSQVEKEVYCNNCDGEFLSTCYNEILQTGNVLIMRLSWFDDQRNILNKAIRPNTMIQVDGKCFLLKGLIHHAGIYTHVILQHLMIIFKILFFRNVASRTLSGRLKSQWTMDKKE